jgi:hypothetical protein
MIGLDALKGEIRIDKLCREHLVEKQFVKRCRETSVQGASTLFDPS